MSFYACLFAIFLSFIVEWLLEAYCVKDILQVPLWKKSFVAGVKSVSLRNSLGDFWFIE